MNDIKDRAITLLQTLVNATGAEFEDEKLAVDIITTTITELMKRYNSDKCNLPVVSNNASSCSFKEVKDIWNAAGKYLLHDMGEICKGDAAYEEHVPDLNTYYERHYNL